MVVREVGARDEERRAVTQRDGERQPERARDLATLVAHHHGQEPPLLREHPLQKRQLDLDRVLRVVSHRREPAGERAAHGVVEDATRLAGDRHRTERRLVGAVARGQHRAFQRIVHGPDDGDDLRPEPARDGKGVARHGAGVSVASVRRHQRDNRAVSLDSAGASQMDVDLGAERPRVARIPVAGDRRGPHVHRAHLPEHSRSTRWSSALVSSARPSTRWNEWLGPTERRPRLGEPRQRRGRAEGQSAMACRRASLSSPNRRR